jgi:prepilin-type N-terminal cleavage/methylation domain-containing protein
LVAALAVGARSSLGQPDLSFARTHEASLDGLNASLSNVRAQWPLVFTAGGWVRQTRQQGFTLIELSIVLVIIGLMVGGVLVGRDLIAAAQVRAQVTQIERYNTAANTFFGKYGYLPGDIPDPLASSVGLQARGIYAGEGDGNGILQGVDGNGPGQNWGQVEGAGETVMFWRDLSFAGLIDGTFNTASSTTPPGSNVTGTSVGLYLPQAKIGQGNYIYAWSYPTPVGFTPPNTNLYGLSAVSGIANAACSWCIASNPGLTALQAYAIDNKIDDGMPRTGRVTAIYADYVTFTWVGWSPNAAAASSATCFDTTSWTYSTGQGNALNCALSFRFQ